VCVGHTSGDVIHVYSVDARSLTLRLTDSALASDLFPESYHSCVGDVSVSEELERDQLPVRWMSVELLEAVMDHRTALHEPAADVVRLLCLLARIMHVYMMTSVAYAELRQQPEICLRGTLGWDLS